MDLPSRKRKNRVNRVIAELNANDVTPPTIIHPSVTRDELSSLNRLSTDARRSIWERSTKRPIHCIGRFVDLSLNRLSTDARRSIWERSTKRPIHCIGAQPVEGTEFVP